MKLLVLLGAIPFFAPFAPDLRLAELSEAGHGGVGGASGEGTMSGSGGLENKWRSAAERW